MQRAGRALEVQRAKGGRRSTRPKQLSGEIGYSAAQSSAVVCLAEPSTSAWVKP